MKERRTAQNTQSVNVSLTKYILTVMDIMCSGQLVSSLEIIYYFAPALYTKCNPSHNYAVALLLSFFRSVCLLIRSTLPFLFTLEKASAIYLMNFRHNNRHNKYNNNNTGTENRKKRIKKVRICRRRRHTFEPVLCIRTYIYIYIYVDIEYGAPILYRRACLCAVRLYINGSLYFLAQYKISRTSFHKIITNLLYITCYTYT